jgi:hypothetical protein
MTFDLFWLHCPYATVCEESQLIFFIADHSVLSSKDVQIYQRESDSAFKLQPDGWVLRQNGDGNWRRLCWLPHKRRDSGRILACYGQKIVIASMVGLLTILDCSDV